MTTSEEVLRLSGESARAISRGAKTIQAQKGGTDENPIRRKAGRLFLALIVCVPAAVLNGQAGPRGASAAAPPFWGAQAGSVVDPGGGSLGPNSWKRMVSASHGPEHVFMSTATLPWDRSIPARAGPPEAHPERTETRSIATRASGQGLSASVRAAIERAKAKPGTWQPVQGSELEPALLSKSTVPGEIWGNKGPRATVVSWNGLAFDKQRGCAYAMGGGHKAYGGNETYAFCWKRDHNLTTVRNGTFAGDVPPKGRSAPVGEWFQLTPQGVPRPPRDTDGDGKKETCRGYKYGPSSTHGYDAWDVTPDGNVWRWGNPGFCRNGYGGEPNNPWKMNPVTKEWSHHPSDVPVYGNNYAINTPHHDLLLGLPKGFYDFTPPDKYDELLDFNGKWDYGVGAYGGGWYVGLHKHRKLGLIAFKLDDRGQILEKHVPLWDVKKTKNAITGWPWNGSIAYHEKRGVFTIWQGDKRLWTLDPEGWLLRKFTLDSETSPNGEQLYNSHVYLDRYDVLLAYTDDPEQPWYVYRLPDAAEGVDVFKRAAEKKADLKARGFSCADTITGWSCPNLSRAVAKGGDVQMPKGIYKQCAVIKRQTRLDMQGSRIQGAVCKRKGTFVQNADFTLENVTIEGARGAQGNEAAIRRQRGATTLINVRLLDNHNGVLGGTGGAFVMRGGVVKGNGCCAQLAGKPAGRAHGLYIADGRIELDGVEVEKATGAGHLVKSGAAELVIRNSRFDETGGRGSRVIDAYNGGRIEIYNTAISAAPDDGNMTVIGYDYEARARHTDNAIVIEGGSVDCAGGRLVAGDNSVFDMRRQIDTRVTDCR